jgi:hypothetical protein
MAQLDTTRELDFLLHETGTDSGALIAQAVQEGIHLLFKRQVIEAYVNNRLERSQAIALLGDEELDQIDYAWQALEKDILWGLSSA